MKIFFVATAFLVLTVYAESDAEAKGESDPQIVHIPGLPPPPAVPILHAAPPAKVAVVAHPPLPGPPPKHVPVLTDQKCHIEEVELVAEVCTPTIERDCRKVKVKSLQIQSREECVQVVKTVCREEEEIVDNTVCYTEYETETSEAEATTATVDYEVKCEDDYQEVCPQKQYGGYGHNGYCKREKTKVCYNTPKASPAKKTISVELPVPREKCEEKQVKLPKVVCEESTEDRCYQLPYTTQEAEDFEQCTTDLGAPKCQQTKVKLPKQVCVGPVAYKPEPVYHAVTPAPYHPPPPPVYHAPAVTPASFHAAAVGPLAFAG